MRIRGTPLRDRTVIEQIECQRRCKISYSMWLAKSCQQPRSNRYMPTKGAVITHHMSRRISAPTSLPNASEIGHSRHVIRGWNRHPVLPPVQKRALWNTTRSSSDRLAVGGDGGEDPPAMV